MVGARVFRAPGVDPWAVIGRPAEVKVWLYPDGEWARIDEPLSMTTPCELGTFVRRSYLVEVREQ